MAATSFPKFTQLPLEIRWKIYWFATPPRVVRLYEKTEEYETFAERIATTPPRLLRLDPELLWFACQWRSIITHLMADDPPERPRCPEYQPWTPSAQAPEIPIALLRRHPKLAFQMLRFSYLVSKAPIPPLLHTCSESRRELERGGFALSFGTRTSGPRTWFNGSRDILLVTGWSALRGTHPGSDPRANPTLVAGCPWQIDQMRIHDMARIRRVAISEDMLDVDCSKVACMLRLFGAVDELFVFHHSEDVWCSGGPAAGTTLIAGTPWPNNMMLCVQYEQSDPALLSIECSNVDCPFGTTPGYETDAPPRVSDSEFPTGEWLEREFQTYSAELLDRWRRDRNEMSPPGIAPASWKIPVLTPGLALYPKSAAHVKAVREDGFRLLKQELEDDSRWNEFNAQEKGFLIQALGDGCPQWLEPRFRILN